MIRSPTTRHISPKITNQAKLGFVGFGVSLLSALFDVVVVVVVVVLVLLVAVVVLLMN